MVISELQFAYDSRILTWNAISSEKYSGSYDTLSDVCGIFIESSLKHVGSSDTTFQKRRRKWIPEQ